MKKRLHWVSVVRELDHGKKGKKEKEREKEKEKK